MTRPHYIRLNPGDNVAVVVNEGGLPAGAEFPCRLTLIEAVPEAHKVALRPLSRGEDVIRYGWPIGRAACDIAAGSWVHEKLLELPAPPALDSLPLAVRPPQPLPPLEGFFFDGYANPDGTFGTRNILGITCTVQCVTPTVEHAVERLRREALPRYPNVDAVVCLGHSYGCGVAIDAPDAAIPVRTLRNVSLNPNLGGRPLVVSLGCEKMQPQRLFPAEELAGAAADVVRLQDERGFQAAVAAIAAAGERRLAGLDQRRRVSVPASGLVVGLQCGGSDALSGVTANPAVGFAADLLVRAGATVLFSEVTEVRDAVHLLLDRAASEAVARDLIREMLWYDAYLARGSADRSANTTPGNKRGGLANIVEKALGSVAKAGSSPLAAVTTHGERVRSKGLVFAATPAGDFVCGTGQLAAGMNVHVFTTGEGSPYGLALAPVIKVSSRTALARRWPDLIDVDAGRVATGEASVSDIGWEIFRLILDTASGRKRPWAEHWGLSNALAPFNPGPVT